MEMNEYQKQAKIFDVSSEKINELTKDGKIRSILKIAHSLSGLAEEAGEAEGKFKKFIRGDLTEEEFVSAIIPELGDVLWYISDSAYNLGITLEFIGKNNLDKLTFRLKRGKIRGDGDNR